MICDGDRQVTSFRASQAPARSLLTWIWQEHGAEAAGACFRETTSGADPELRDGTPSQAQTRLSLSHPELYNPSHPQIPFLLTLYRLSFLLLITKAVLTIPASLSCFFLSLTVNGETPDH